ncbi:MAG: hypothetical protein AAF743_13875, partial [Planctomycetota bacterium]
ILSCPEASELNDLNAAQFPSSYGINSAMRSEEWNFNRARVRGSSEIVLAGDKNPSGLEWATVTHVDQTQPLDVDPDLGYFWGWDNLPSTQVQIQGPFPWIPMGQPRHGAGDKINNVFVDGHAAPNTPYEMRLYGGLHAWWLPVVEGNDPNAI